MKHTGLLLVLLLLVTGTGLAQSGPYSRVRFEADKAAMDQLIEAGVALDHLDKNGDIYTGEFSKEETQAIKKYCRNVLVLLGDVSLYFKGHSHAGGSGKRALIYPPPAGFTYGSMGGYLTLEQADSHFRVMRDKYPGLISARDSMGLSYEGRTIFSFKISDNPDVDEDEAEVLYTAVHHAREPMSLMQMIYFAYYLLENYAGDSIVKKLVDQSEMYFVPFVNPDGYKYNELTNPEGGGMWRKNRRPTSDTTYGIDLNRNYGYEWGKNNVGSSNVLLSETYRGSSAFSEPETQVIRDFCAGRHFIAALNYHAFGNYVLYPWGNDLGPSSAVDYPLFEEMAIELTAENFYLYGTCFQTLSYITNGGSDDWMYGELQLKKKILAFTPEVGNSNDGFWPLPERIYPLCDENIGANLYLVKKAILLNTPPASLSSAVNYIPAIYPNPGHGLFQVNFAWHSGLKLEVYNMQGELIFSGDSPSGDISSEADGIYLVRVVSAKGTVYTSLLSLQH